MPLSSDHLVQLMTTTLAAVSGIAAFLKARQVGDQIKEVKVSIDGRLEQLLAVTRSEAHAVGVTAGIASGEKWSAELRAAELKAAELQAEALKAEAVKVAEALRLADLKANELKAAQVHSSGQVNVTGSPVIIHEQKEEEKE